MRKINKTPAIAKPEIETPEMDDMYDIDDTEEDVEEKEKKNLDELQAEITRLKADIENKKKAMEETARFIIKEVTTQVAPTLIDSTTGEPVNVMAALAKVLNMMEQQNKK